MGNFREIYRVQEDKEVVIFPPKLLNQNYNKSIKRDWLSPAQIEH